MLQVLVKDDVHVCLSGTCVVYTADARLQHQAWHIRLHAQLLYKQDVSSCVVSASNAQARSGITKD